MKRQKLVIEALAKTQEPVEVRFAGLPDFPPYLDELMELTETLGVADRVKWLGFVSDEEKRNLFARAKGVIFPPVDEDYGYITLEAMLASKPVVTVSDAGGPLEFVINEENGLVAEPTPESLAEALDQLWGDPSRARLWGEAGRERFDNLGIYWPKVVERLLE